MTFGVDKEEFSQRAEREAHHRHLVRKLKAAAATLLAFVPLSALPEGAIKLLDCTRVLLCDSTAQCGPETGTIAFRMEPKELAEAGEGSYTLSYSDNSVEMQAVSDTGPFLWNVGNERNALMPSSETEWLWHRLLLEAVPASEIRFLRCRFQQ